MNIVPEKMMYYMQRLLNRLTATCDVISETISESVDHKISAGRRLKVRVHILFCRFCRRYYRQIHALHALFEERLKREERDTLPEGPSLSDEARNRIKQNLKRNPD